MTEHFFIYVLSIFFLLLFSAFFSGSEAALFSLNRLEIDRIRAVKENIGRTIAELLEKPRALITTIFLANEVVNSAISILAASVFHALLPHLRWQWVSLVSIAVSTTLLLFLGEIIPKAVALRNADTFSIACAGPVSVFFRMIAPLRIVLTKIADGIIALFGSKPQSDAEIIKEEEFRFMVETGGESGVLEPLEEELIQNVFDFGDKTVSEIMTPRGKIFSLPCDLPWIEFLNKMRSEKFGRVPIYKTKPDNVIGILFVKDLLKQGFFLKEELSCELETLLRKPYSISPKKKLDELFHEFKTGKVHMALVVDELGALVGLVSMDDLLRELFG